MKNRSEQVEQVDAPARLTTSETPEQRRGFRFWAAVIASVLTGLILAALWIWRDDIVKGVLDPKVPYVRYHPPAAPDYSRRADWAMAPTQIFPPAAGDPPADVFFVHPTTFDGGKDWNGPLHDRAATVLLSRVMLPNYAAPFAEAGRLYVPRYRQASLYTKASNWDDAIDARRFAYGDVRAAFDVYRDSFNHARPFILVGVEQGGELAARLLREEIGKDPALRRRLVAAYLIETLVPADEHAAKSPVPLCAQRRQAGCLVAYASVEHNDFPSAQRLLDRARVWDDAGELVFLGGRPGACVNPLLGAASDVAAPARLNLGAVAATGLDWGVRPGFLVRQSAAQCDGGLLRFTTPRSTLLRPSGNWIERAREPGYNLFWADLEADATARLAVWLAAHPAPPQPASAPAPARQSNSS
ncbi:MAG: DUF3089 domain-containing protein [Caulobacterales bacterium]